MGCQVHILYLQYVASLVVLLAGSKLTTFCMFHPFSYSKPDSDTYEAQAQGHMKPLTPSQISVHVGMDDRRRDISSNWDQISYISQGSANKISRQNSRQSTGERLDKWSILINEADEDQYM